MRKYYLGERFPLKFLVHSTTGDPFRVLSASWELERYGKPESSGKCEITTDEEGNTYLSMTLEPKQAGGYTLEISFTIGECVIKRKVKFAVDL